MRVRYFAWLRQRTGTSAEEINPPSNVVTVADLIDHLSERHPRFGEAAAASGVVRCAVNQDYVGRDHALRAGDEVAFFPPVTGG